MKRNKSFVCIVTSLLVCLSLSIYVNAIEPNGPGGFGGSSSSNHGNSIGSGPWYCEGYCGYNGWTVYGQVVRDRDGVWLTGYGTDRTTAFNRIRARCKQISDPYRNVVYGVNGGVVFELTVGYLLYADDYYSSFAKLNQVYRRKK